MEFVWWSSRRRRRQKSFVFWGRICKNLLWVVEESTKIFVSCGRMWRKCQNLLWIVEESAKNFVGCGRMWRKCKSLLWVVEEIAIFFVGCGRMWWKRNNLLCQCAKILMGCERMWRMCKNLLWVVEEWAKIFVAVGECRLMDVLLFFLQKTKLVKSWARSQILFWVQEISRILFRVWEICFRRKWRSQSGKKKLGRRRRIVYLQLQGGKKNS